MPGFQSTLPARGATGNRRCVAALDLGFNPRSPHGERPNVIAPAADDFCVSIHAPRTGSDLTARTQRTATGAVSIHAPRTGSDWAVVYPCQFGRKFQSTLPARGATQELAERMILQRVSIHAPRTGSDVQHRAFRRRHPQFQSTLPARGATGAASSSPGSKTCFNPRSPHGERPACVSSRYSEPYFNPRSPHGERQDFFGSHVFFLLISIHAPRTGSDGRWKMIQGRYYYFNPRSPHGERQSPGRTPGGSHDRFQSTLPARGATLPEDAERITRRISIHAPRTGSDGRGGRGSASTRRFQSTLPARGATRAGTGRRATWTFQSTLPARGATWTGLFRCWRA